jgi:hypothetical protein
MEWTMLMTRLMRLSLAVLALGGSLAAAHAEGLGKKEVLATAGQLAQQIAMPAEKRVLVEKRLAALLEDAKFQAKYGNTPIRGVFAYQIGEGGLIFGVKKGHGVAKLAGEAGEPKLKFKGLTVGAQIGGSSEWGLGLVFGLSSPRAFGGEYAGTAVAATMAETGTATMELTSKGADAHKIYLVGTAKGASANAGGGRLTIEVAR